MSAEAYLGSAVPAKQLITEKILAAAETRGTPIVATIHWSVSDDKTVNFGTEEEPLYVCMWQQNLVLIEATVMVVPNEASLKELEEAASGRS
ncbi:hypothetical protein FGG51_gp068 [Mycobacterium phage Astro]|uniref:Uncharacterized protein n=1 Tax=Mycobacterium phage Astro TaxID=2902840 RepID=I6S7B0_9CAUD|nr:hypothetical protein FGG51_gp068 [Mycobacterium phage Astro]AFM54930.1 hypothetical protein ASTRO_38 [Mycobacterium phage Astro]